MVPEGTRQLISSDLELQCSSFLSILATVVIATKTESNIYINWIASFAALVVGSLFRISDPLSFLRRSGTSNDVITRGSKWKLSAKGQDIRNWHSDIQHFYNKIRKFIIRFHVDSTFPCSCVAGCWYCSSPTWSSMETYFVEWIRSTRDFAGSSRHYKIIQSKS
jgi:hypothetical protein